MAASTSTRRSSLPPIPALLIEELSSCSVDTADNALLPATAFNCLRVLGLGSCPLDVAMSLFEQTLEILILNDCEVPWGRMFVKNTISFGHLRVLELTGHALAGIGACAWLDLCALQKLVLYGDVNDVVTALDRMAVPASASMRLSCTTDSTVYPTPDQLLTPLATHFAHAREQGDYFTQIYIQHDVELGLYLRCDVPGTNPALLGESTAVEVRLGMPSPLRLPSYLAALTSALPLDAGICVLQDGGQKLCVMGDEEVWDAWKDMSAKEWATIATNVRAVKTLNVVHWPIPDPLRLLLSAAATVESTPAWPLLRNIRFLVELEDEDENDEETDYWLAYKVCKDSDCSSGSGAEEEQVSVAAQVAEELFRLFRKENMSRVKYVGERQAVIPNWMM